MAIKELEEGNKWKNKCYYEMNGKQIEVQSESKAPGTRSNLKLEREVINIGVHGKIQKVHSWDEARTGKKK